LIFEIWIFRNRQPDRDESMQKINQYYKHANNRNGSQTVNKLCYIITIVIITAWYCLLGNQKR